MCSRGPDCGAADPDREVLHEQSPYAIALVRDQPVCWSWWCHSSRTSVAALTSNRQHPSADNGAPDHREQWVFLADSGIDVGGPVRPTLLAVRCSLICARILYRWCLAAHGLQQTPVWRSDLGCTGCSAPLRVPLL